MLRMKTRFKLIVSAPPLVYFLLLSNHPVLSAENQQTPDEILYQGASTQKRPNVWTTSISSREELRAAVCYYIGDLISEYKKLPASLPRDKEHWAHAMINEDRGLNNMKCASDYLLCKRRFLVEFAGEKAVSDFESHIERTKHPRKNQPKVRFVEKNETGDHPPFDSLKDPRVPWKDVGYSDLPREADP